MTKDWFDYLVGAAQIATGIGVLFAFWQVRVTQKQLNVAQEQLEEERKNGKPEVHIIANDEGGGISVAAINVKSVPIFVKSITVEITTKNDKRTFSYREIDEMYGIDLKGLEGVLTIGEHCRVWFPESFFVELFLGLFIKQERVEKFDVIFNIPGILPHPRISFALKKGEKIISTEDDIRVNTLIVVQLTQNGEETIAEWELRLLTYL